MNSTSSSRVRRTNNRLKCGLEVLGWQRLLDDDQADAVEQDVSLALRAIDAVPAVHRLRRRECDPGRFAVRAEKAHLQVAVHQAVQGDLVDDPVHVAPPEVLEEAAHRCHINEPAKLRQTPIVSVGVGSHAGSALRPAWRCKARSAQEAASSNRPSFVRTKPLLTHAPRYAASISSAMSMARSASSYRPRRMRVAPFPYQGISAPGTPARVAAMARSYSWRDRS